MNGRSMRAVLAAVLMAGSVVLASCGGGGDSSAVDLSLVSELPITEAQKNSLQGTWPMDDKQTSAFVVRSADEWDRLWAARKAQVTCNDYTRAYEGAFCDSTAPPPIDFSRYTLVGILINSTFYFDTPTPRSVEILDDGRLLSVSYRFIDPSTPTFYYTTLGRFFLVPRTAAALSVQSKLCRFSC